MPRVSNEDSAILVGLERQYRAAIEMLRRAIHACPDRLWSVSKEEKAFWHKAYYTLYYLDVYLSCPARSFKEPPFHRPRAEGLATRLTKPFTREEIEGYLEDMSAKSARLFRRLTPEMLERKPRYGRHGTFLNALLYNLRHIMLHVGQMYSFLRRKTGEAPDWA